MRTSNELNDDEVRTRYCEIISTRAVVAHELSLVSIICNTLDHGMVMLLDVIVPVRARQILSAAELF